MAKEEQPLSMEEISIDDEKDMHLSSEIVCAWDNRDDEDLAKLFVINHGESNITELDMSYLIKPPQSSIDAKTDFLKLLGCSNGLVFINQLFDFDKDEFVAGSNLVLWNPSTKHFQKLPEPINPTSTPNERPSYKNDIGFGKDSDDYKIVRITNFEDWLHVQLFTQKTGRWRDLGTISNATLAFAPVDWSVADDEFIYWVVLHGNSSYKILTFNLDTDELTEIDGPDLPNRDKIFELINIPYSFTPHDFQLFKWKGFVGFKSAVGREYRFWLKTVDGWTKMPVDIPYSKGLFDGVFRDKFILLEAPCEYILFDPLTKIETLFKAEFGDILPHNTFKYIPSLISPSYNQLM